MVGISLNLLKSIFKIKKSHFLVVMQNNNELRPTGGFITKVMDITTGRLRAKPVFLDVFTDLTKHKVVAPPKQIKEMLSDSFYKSWTFRDANTDPDFEKSSEKMIEFYNLVYPKNHVSGLAAINFSFIEDLIEITGPIKFNKKILTKENLFYLLSANAADIDRHDLDSIRQRKDVINGLFKKLIRKCAVKFFKWGKLNNLIKKSIKNKNLQIWFENNNRYYIPFDYKGFDDYMAVSESNFLGGKSNRYIKRTIFRNTEFTGKGAKVYVGILWEHLGKFNPPLSTTYKAYVNIYSPAGIKELKLEMPPGGKIDYVFDYEIKKKWLKKGLYSFKYIKQSGVCDETLLENFTAPVQYQITNNEIKNAVINENTCSLRHFVKEDIQYKLKIKNTGYGPRIIMHNLIAPDTAEIRFSEPIKFSNKNILKSFKCYAKDTKKRYKISKVKLLNQNTAVQLSIESLPEKEEKFYVIEMSNIENKTGNKLENMPRKATVVFRKNHLRN